MRLFDITLNVNQFRNKKFAFFWDCDKQRNRVIKKHIHLIFSTDITLSTCSLPLFLSYKRQIVKIKFNDKS